MMLPERIGHTACDLPIVINRSCKPQFPAQSCGNQGVQVSPPAVCPQSGFTYNLTRGIDSVSPDAVPPRWADILDPTRGVPEKGVDSAIRAFTDHLAGGVDAVRFRWTRKRIESTEV